MGLSSQLCHAAGPSSGTVNGRNGGSMEDSIVLFLLLCISRPRCGYWPHFRVRNDPVGDLTITEMPDSETPAAEIFQKPVSVSKNLAYELPKG